VVVAGNAVCDILVRPVDEVRWGTTTWVETIQESVGGNGANTSYTLAAFGTRVRLLSAVGQDSYGDTIVDVLRKAGVDIDGVARLATATATTVVLVQSSGARAFLHKPGASGDAFTSPIDFNTDDAVGFTRFHVANVFALPGLRPHAAESLHRARAARLSTSMDTGWDATGEWARVIGPCLPYLDLLFVNEDEARMLTGLSTPEEAALAFRNGGVGVVVVKLGAAGCAVSSPAGTFRSPGFAVPVVDTTGAGDAFAGAFLAALERGLNLEAAARFANAAGALVVQELGAVAGMRDFRGNTRLDEDFVTRRIAGPS
jgi:sugar/nucleoside kinase (ribokinase family)